jgi:hypothetical protein
VSVCISVFATTHTTASKKGANRYSCTQAWQDYMDDDGVLRDTRVAFAHVYHHTMGRRYVWRGAINTDVCCAKLLIMFSEEYAVLKSLISEINDDIIATFVRIKQIALSLFNSSN